MSRRKNRRCIDCGDSLTGRGGRAIRCETCQSAVDQERDRDRHAANRERRSTLRRLHRQGLSDPELAEVLEVVDYSRGGFTAPGLASPVTYRQNARHDAVSRARLEVQEAADDEPDQASWGDLQAVRNSGRFIDFHAPDMTPGPDPWGRSVPRHRGIFGHSGDVPVITNPAAYGELYRPSPIAGQRAVLQHVEARFGQKARMDAPIHSGQLDSSVPTLQAREAAQVERQQLASGHMRVQAGDNAWRR